MTDYLMNEDFETILFNYFGVTRAYMVDRLDVDIYQYERRMHKWRHFLEQAKTYLLDSAEKGTLGVLKQLQVICNYQDQLDDAEYASLCEKFAAWKTSRQQIADLIDHMHVVNEIPQEGLDNRQLEGALLVMQKTFGGVQLFRVQTRDFMFCDVQKRFTDYDYPSDHHVDLIKKHLLQVDQTGKFKDIYHGLLEGSAFGQLTGPKLNAMYAMGADFLGIIINTANCNEGGTHWVAVVIDHQSRSIELFDSTGEYKYELQPVYEFCKFLAAECSSIFDKKYYYVLSDDPVQEDPNTCGVFSLLYIYARILGITPQNILYVLKSRYGNNYLRLFKYMLFA